MSEQDQIEQGHEAQGLAEQQQAEQERAEAYRDLMEARLRACGDAAAEVVKAAEELEKWKSEYGRLLAENLRLINAWQPIQTAPKSGKAILLYWSCCKDPTVGRWEDDGIREGWRGDGDQCVPKNQHNCTHWMTLPEPPNAGTTGK